MYPRACRPPLQARNKRSNTQCFTPATNIQICIYRNIESPWRLSLGLVPGACPWRLSLALVPGACPWGLSLGLVPGTCPWICSDQTLEGPFQDSELLFLNAENHLQGLQKKKSFLNDPHRISPGHKQGPEGPNKPKEKYNCRFHNDQALPQRSPHALELTRMSLTVFLKWSLAGIERIFGPSSQSSHFFKRTF